MIKIIIILFLSIIISSCNQSYNGEPLYRDKLGTIHINTACANIDGTLQSFELKSTLKQKRAQVRLKYCPVCFKNNLDRDIEFKIDDLFLDFDTYKSNICINIKNRDLTNLQIQGFLGATQFMDIDQIKKADAFMEQKAFLNYLEDPRKRPEVYNFFITENQINMSYESFCFYLGYDIKREAYAWEIYNKMIDSDCYIGDFSYFLIELKEHDKREKIYELCRKHNITNMNKDQFDNLLISSTPH